MRIRVPRKKVREQFLIIYELEGCQKAINFLSEYYGTKKMRVILNGKKLGKNCEAFYFEGKAYFSKRSLKKRNVLHEFYHFLVDSKGLDISERAEEKEANRYSKEFLKKY
jgi:N-glycosylase/DNA lyase